MTCSHSHGPRPNQGTPRTHPGCSDIGESQPVEFAAVWMLDEDSEGEFGKGSSGAPVAGFKGLPKPDWKNNFSDVPSGT